MPETAIETTLTTGVNAVFCSGGGDSDVAVDHLDSGGVLLTVQADDGGHATIRFSKPQAESLRDALNDAGDSDSEDDDEMAAAKEMYEKMKRIHDREARRYASASEGAGRSEFETTGTGEDE